MSSHMVHASNNKYFEFQEIFFFAPFMAIILFLFFAFLKSVYKDKVYHNCLVRLKNKEITDAANPHKRRKKRKNESMGTGESFVERERPLKRAKTKSIDKTHLKCVTGPLETSLDTGNRSSGDNFETDDVQEDYIIENETFVICNKSASYQTNDYHYYTGSWRSVLTNKHKKIEFKFLLFGLHQKSEDNIRDNYVTNHLAAQENLTDETKPKNQEYIVIRRLPCKMDLTEYDIEYISAMLAKQSLFKEKEQPFVIVSNVNIDGDATITDTLSNHSCYYLFKELENGGISYKTLQMMYILFMTQWLLVYDGVLDCWILKKKLLPFHVYFGECYVYVMWKLRHLNVNIAQTHKEKYKKCLLEELEYFCILIDLYEAIRAEGQNGTHYKKLVAFLYYQVELLRKCISEYLQIFNKQTCTTSMYFMANNMRNMTVNIKSATSQTSSTTKQNNEKYRRSKTGNVKRPDTHVAELIHTEFYYRFHTGRYKKHLLFILAFTADFECIEKENGGSDTLMFIIEASLKGVALDSNFYKRMDRKKPFKGSVDKIIEFFVMLYKFKESEQYFVGDLEYYKKAQTTIWSDHRVLANQKLASTYKPNAYREAILMSMGINILDLIEQKCEVKSDKEGAGDEEPKVND